MTTVLDEILFMFLWGNFAIREHVRKSSRTYMESKVSLAYWSESSEDGFGVTANWLGEEKRKSRKGRTAYKIHLQISFSYVFDLWRWQGVSSSISEDINLAPGLNQLQNFSMCLPHMNRAWNLNPSMTKRPRKYLEF